MEGYLNQFQRLLAARVQLLEIWMKSKPFIHAISGILMPEWTCPFRGLEVISRYALYHCYIYHHILISQMFEVSCQFRPVVSTSCKPTFLVSADLTVELHSARHNSEFESLRCFHGCHWYRLNHHGQDLPTPKMASRKKQNIWGRLFFSNSQILSWDPVFSSKYPVFWVVI